MKTKIFLFTTFILISLINVNAQTVTDTVHLVPSSVQEGKFISKTNVVTYDYSQYAIGKIFPTYPDSSSVVSRTYHPFSLSSIPTNATITSVKVIYTTFQNYKGNKYYALSPDKLGDNRKRYNFGPGDSLWE